MAIARSGKVCMSASRIEERSMYGRWEASGVLLRQKSIFHFSEAPSTTFHPSVQAFSENLLRASFGSPSLSII